MSDFNAPGTLTRILVVDDHPFFREGIVAWLQRQPNLRVCGMADSTSSALAAIHELKPDLVLLDLRLRDSDGLDVLRRLKADGIETRVIVVSNNSESVFAERTLRYGAKGYVLKDEAAEIMLSAIDTVLHGGTFVSGAMRPKPGADLPVVPFGASEKIQSLYNREIQVLELLGRGFTTKEIASRLELSGKTIETYRENLKKKLGFADSATLIHFATLWQSSR